MFSRVLKSTNSQQQPSSQAPASPTKSSRSGHTKSQSTAAPSPSKIPVPSTPSSRSSFLPTGSKENLPAVPPSPSQQNNERSNYLSFLFSQNQAGAPTTHVKVNKAAPSHVAPNPGHAHHCPEIVAQREEKPVYPRDSEDVHMVTMKNTVNPAMLKQLASIPQHNQAASSAPAVAQKQSNPLNSYAAQRGGAYQPDDVHMKTAARHDTRYEKERGLQLWERELLETPDVRRKATVAQICKLHLRL